MKSAVLLILLTALSATHAKSEAVFHVEQGNWSIYNTANHCVATNRPAIETNISPYMQLNVLYDLQSEEVSIVAYFWPGAFEEGEQVLMTLSDLHEDFATLQATAALNYAIRSDRALTLEELRALGDATVLIVGAEGVTDRLGAQTENNFGFLRFDLANCARFVAGDRN